MAFYEDMLQISHAVYSALKPDKMNYELLGNWGNHLHWHVIPRYRDDPWWGNPIWIDAHPTEKRLRTVKNLDKDDYRRLKKAIIKKLS
jgi:diadenosine tetraphosphate (Ap4A) HIT family hydrolase